MSTMKKRVLIIRSKPSDPRAERVANALKYHYKVTFLGWDRESEYPKSEKNEYYDIKRLKLRAPYGDIRLVIYLPIWWIFIIIFLITKNYDIVHVCNFDSLVAVMIARFFKRKFRVVYDIYDLFVNMLPQTFPRVMKGIFLQSAH